MEIKRTRDLHRQGVKMLAYGQAGAGKTCAIATLPEAIVLSAEGGLLSIQGVDLPYIEIATVSDLTQSITWLQSSHEATQYQSVAVDSISEIAEVVLAAELRRQKDGRAAYGEMGTVMNEVIRALRDLPGRHVYVTAKLDKAQDEMGRMLYAPSMPGKSLSQQLPYFFDEVLALRVEKDADGNQWRGLLAQPDGAWLAKDRSGRLDAWEPVDLLAVISKIGANDNG